MVDKLRVAMADVTLATMVYPLTKLKDFLWKPSQQTLDSRLVFNVQLAELGSKSTALFIKDALKKGANPDVTVGKDKEPLVITATRTKLPKIVALLGDAGANLDATDKWGDTALVHAAYVQSQDTVEYLLRKDVKVDQKLLEQQGGLAVTTFTRASATFNTQAAANQNAPESKFAAKPAASAKAAM